MDPPADRSKVSGGKCNVAAHFRFNCILTEIGTYLSAEKSCPAQCGFACAFTSVISGRDSFIALWRFVTCFSMATNPCRRMSKRTSNTDRSMAFCNGHGFWTIGCGNCLPIQTRLASQFSGDYPASILIYRAHPAIIAPA